MRKAILFLSAFFLTALSCKTASYQPEIYPIWASAYKESYRYIYVVSNPVPENAELLHIADAFFRESITPEDIENADIKASFYRESAYLNQDFHAGKPYPGRTAERFETFLGRDEEYQELNNHQEDLLLEMELRFSQRSKQYVYSYCLFSDHNFGKDMITPTAWYYRERHFTEYNKTERPHRNIFDELRFCSVYIYRSVWEGALRFADKAELLRFLGKTGGKQ